MEGDIQRSRQLDQLARAVDVDAALGVKQAENDAVRTKILGEGNVAAHDLDFFGSVAEISTAGTDNDLQANGELGADYFDQAGTRGDSALDQIAAQLDAVSAALLRSHCRRHRVDADFDQYLFGHGVFAGSQNICT